MGQETTPSALPGSPENFGPPPRPPSHHGLVAERDVMVTMRDGVRICIDVYRP